MAWAGLRQGEVILDLHHARSTTATADLLRWGVDVLVECYAGYRAEETPRRLLVGGRSVEIVEVWERWRTPEARGFRLRGDDGALYVLVQDDRSGRWTAEIGEAPRDTNRR